MSLELENKKIISKFYKELHKATKETIGKIVEKYYHSDAVIHGPHPINEVSGVRNIIDVYYAPMAVAFPTLKKVPHLLLAGHYDDYREAVDYCGGDRVASLKYQYIDATSKEIPVKPKDGGNWVGSTGYMVSSFEKDWLGIPANEQVVFIRYGEFYKIENGKIKEKRFLIDMLDFMRQAGFKFIEAPAVELIIPGPQTQDGVLLHEADASETEKTRQVVNQMVVGLVNVKNQATSVWAEDFMWYGPAGIGTTTGTKAFRKYHQQPFVKAHPDRVGGTNHATRFADGNYMAFTGWPSVIGTHTGNEGWLALPATNKPLAINVMDFYRREGDQIVENWVLIDIVKHLHSLGIDLFKRIEEGMFYSRSRKG